MEVQKNRKRLTNQYFIRMIGSKVLGKNVTDFQLTRAYSLQLSEGEGLCYIQTELGLNTIE